MKFMPNLPQIDKHYAGFTKGESKCDHAHLVYLRYNTSVYFASPLVSTNQPS